MEALKPTWQTGSSAPLDLAKLRKQKDASDTTAPQKLRLDLEEGDDADDLVDEDALLTEEDRQRPAAGLKLSTLYTFPLHSIRSPVVMACLVLGSWQFQCHSNKKN